MSGKLDQSLDDIVKDRRSTNRGRGRARRAPNTGRTTATAAPVGGVAKNKGRGPGPKPAAHPPVPITGSGESKIVVSGLPTDISESNIKEYFGTTIGPVKRVMLTYGPNGQSRGVATIIFNKPGSALEAATKLDSVKVDGRPMKIEVIVKANQAPTQIPAKALGDRIATAKAVAKATPKSATPRAPGAAAGNGRGRGRKGRPAGRKPKTAEELDAEMVDYFEPGTAAATGDGVTAAANGAAPAATTTTGDAGMEDEIM